MADSLVHALQAWASAWGVSADDPAAAVTCIDAAERKCTQPPQPSSLQWQLLGTIEEQRALWWAVLPASSAARAATASAMLFVELFGVSPGAAPSFTRAGDGGAPTMAQTLADAALADCANKLASAFGAVCETTGASAGVEQAPPAALFKPWSGALVLSVAWCGGEMRVLIDPACVMRTLGSRRATAESYGRRFAATPVLRALQSKTVRLEAVLGRFELELGTLSALRIGDIVRTPFRLDDPLTVSTSAGVALSEAYLGRCDSVRAVELKQAAHPLPTDRDVPAT